MSATNVDHGSNSQAQSSQPASPAVSPKSIDTSQLPSTPNLRGRPPSRYPPSLSLGDPGRVPLHRRGTSKTYECLEDLLREAGYKETRVFTPETDRSEERRKSSVKGGVDAVVNFLTGWIPGASKSSGDLAGNVDSSEQQDSVDVSPGEPSWSVPPSPLAHKRVYMGPGVSSLSPSASSTTIASMRSYRSGNANGRAVSSRLPDSPHLQPPPQQAVRPRASASESLRTFVNKSAARSSLRPMASTPNIPRRLPSTHENSAERLSICLDGDTPPALPSRWYENATQAMQRSDSQGAFIGGPPSRSRGASRQPRPRSARGPRFMLSDHTNRPSSRQTARSASRFPPGLLSSCAQRGGTAPGAVSAARVMCRSAPASRSSSHVDVRASAGVLEGQEAAMAGKAARKAKGKGKGARSAKDGVPMLANTLIENDVWGLQWVQGRRVLVSSQDGPLVTCQDEDVEGAEDGEDDEDDDDEDDDGELGLEQILVNPKRQYSIQSLRKNLHSMRRSSGASPRASATCDDQDDDYGIVTGGHGRGRRGSMDEGQHAHAWAVMGAPGFDRPAKRRTGIPSGWKGIGGGRS